jgi:ketosteroid isomerase-like protein
MIGVRLGGNREKNMDLGKAVEFANSYDRASRSGDPQIMADHYAEPYTSFTLGNVTQFADKAAARAQMGPWLARFKQFGLDDMHLVQLSIDTVSETFALCHLTWEIRPRSALAPWRWTNVYGLRQDAAGQRFEFAVSDNEIANLLQRFPDFLALPGAG